jgi:hypothetical protein
MFVSRKRKLYPTQLLGNRVDVKQSQTPASSRVAQQLAETIAKIKNQCETKPI